MVWDRACEQWFCPTLFPNPEKSVQISLKYIKWRKLYAYTSDVVCEEELIKKFILVNECPNKYGFITFRDITQLYLKARHNFKGHVLTITSDCSYSGCWVRDYMEFLDEQGVQPCGHKAREKGMVIKVYASCQSNETSTEYCFIVSGTGNDKNTGVMGFWPSKKLLESQTTEHINHKHTCSYRKQQQVCQYIYLYCLV